MEIKEPRVKQDSTPIYLPANLKIKFKNWCLMEGRTMSGTIRNLIEELLKNKE